SGREVPPHHDRHQEAHDGDGETPPLGEGERPGGHATTLAGKPSRVGAGFLPELRQSVNTRPRRTRPGSTYTTRLTSLSGTTNARGSPPFRCAWTFSDAFARSISSPSESPAGTSILSRTLPFTWRTSCTVSRCSSRSSATGHGSSHNRSWPNFVQSSSATWGAYGWISDTAVS